VVKFIEDNHIETLNVAGPRASGWREGRAFSLAVIEEAIRNSRTTSVCTESVG